MVQPSLTILIVDDCAEDREVYQRYLLSHSEYSHIILEASSGAQGISLWQQHRPDVVLLDYRLPDIDGLEFLNRLQSESPLVCLPVIIVTGQGNEAIAVQLMKAGAQDYLIKEQITPQGLNLTINSVIETVQLRIELHQRIERERLVAQITQKIHQSLNLEEILQTTVTEVREFLQTDRVLIFRLQSECWGRVVTESIGSQWRSLLSSSLYDPYLNKHYAAISQELTTIRHNIYDGITDPCHIKLLANLQVQANLIAPIVAGNQLWGMLIAHHCVSPRQWQALEVDLLKELATQVGISIQQAELYQQAQNELIKSEERFYTLVENMSQLAWLANETGSIFWYNRRWFEYTGTTLEEMQEDGWQKISHPDHVDRVVEHLRHCFETGELWEDTFPLRGRDGQYCWFLARGTPIYDQESGNIMRWVGTYTDITERHKAEEERKQLLHQEQAARAEAETANRLKDEFLAVLSHELRSPLNPILGWTQLMQSHRFNPERRTEALAAIARNAKLQLKLVDDLLDIAKIIRNKFSMEMVPINLVSPIKAALYNVREAALAKSIRLYPVLPAMVKVSGDANRLQQIFGNLLINAIKFTPNHGQVDIRLSLLSDDSPSSDDPVKITKYAEISVQDTGIGINPDFLPYIFESFRQEDTSITRRYGGLGLGLAIVHHLVEAHGGSIWVDSQGEGLGATFTVRLPLLPSQLTENLGEIISQQELELRGIRVLTVDDELDTREFLTELLTEYGAEVLTVSSAMEVLANLESFQPNILISDIRMPEMDGYTLIQQIRALPREKWGQIPAIALTAHGRENDYQQAIASGYQWHLTKPVEPDELVQIILTLTSA